MNDPGGEDPGGPGIGCRPMAEALAVGWGLFALGAVLLLGSDPATVATPVRFLFFAGAPVTAALQALWPAGIPFAWPVDLLSWALAAVWVAGAADRRGWRRRLGAVLAVVATVALLSM